MDAIAGSGCEINAAPVSRSPQITLKTPGGSCSAMISAISSVVTGGVCDGLSTTVFPAAMAGVHFHITISIGEFLGLTGADTPTTSRRISDVYFDMYAPAL